MTFDWSWREESGEWRFFFIDVPDKHPSIACYTLANARWPDMPADTDVLIYRPDHNEYFSGVMPEVFGPYGLALSGASRRTHTVDGMWPFETATGGPSEWVAGEAAPGLNLIQLHNVLSSGTGAVEPISLDAGQVWLEPGQLDLVPGQTSAEVRVSTSVALPGLSSLAFGFALPNLLAGQPISQDYSHDPSTARWTKDLTVTAAGMIDITTSSPDPIDIDLYLLYDANGDGIFDGTYEVVALSASSVAAEHIRYYLPKGGRYRIAVHGYRVPKPSKFEISILVAEARDIQVSVPAGAFRRGRPETVGLTFPPAPEGGVGIIFLGPPEAPGVIPLPVKVTSGG